MRTLGVSISRLPVLHGLLIFLDPAIYHNELVNLFRANEQNTPEYGRFPKREMSREMS